MDGLFHQDSDTNGASIIVPLIFAVNAIVTNNNGDDNSLFDKLLTALASSTAEDADSGDNDGISSTSSHGGAAEKRRSISLFRADEEEDDSDIGENFIEGGGKSVRKTFTTFGSSLRNSASSPLTSAIVDGINLSYAKILDNANGRKKGFFQQARIVPVSARYGFPPSKDPIGTCNMACSLLSALQQTPRKRSQSQASHQFSAHEDKQQLILSVFSQYKSALNGILPSGWIEKHVHALPSVILVACTVSANWNEQKVQDQHLFETIEHLQYSLVPKRKCPIQIVAILKADVTPQQADTWHTSVLNEIVANTVSNLEENGASTSLNSLSSGETPQVSILLLHASNDMNLTPVGLQKLHRATRDASLLYYLRQARRSRDKLSKLLSSTDDAFAKQRRPPSGKSPPPLELSPIIIRTCIKIATFYEFQLTKHEKSILFLMEAYRHGAKYYQWLLSIDNNNMEEDSSICSSDHGTSVTETGSIDGTEGVEVEFGSNSISQSKSMTSPKKFTWSRLFPQPPDDMVYQCRSIADWLNVKLIGLGLASETSNGYIAVAHQWRQHTRIFGSITSRRKVVLHNNANISLKMKQQPDKSGRIIDHYYWYEWLCITRQRIALSQLLERNPPKLPLPQLSNTADTAATVVDDNCPIAMDEAIVTCSLWRSYVSATESMLRLGREIKHEKKLHDDTTTEQEHGTKKDTSPSRQRYVGGIGPESLNYEFQQECCVQHQEKALEFILKASALFEEELIRDKRGFYAEDEFSERCSSRTGARIFYLAGGILLGMDQHEQAASHLIKAAKYSKGWRELELCIRRMLIECYEKHIPSNSTESNENSETLVSMILDSYFNAEMSSKDLRRALNHFASISGGETLKWYHARTLEDNTPGLPFSFAVSFPGKTHGTAGDTVQASVRIKSNLDYAVHVNSVVLKSLAGNLPIAATDLLRATNASEGSEGGIIIQAQTSIIVSTNVKLPRDLSEIASDDSGNGGEQQGVAGKGSFAKSARPRSAGISAAGGARLVSEDKLSAGNRNSQGWNLRYLGGKPLLCDGLCIVFYPVQAEMSSGGTEKVTFIELTIERKSSRTAANIKRTPFEEENYVASAWSRPTDHPLSMGPRSIRVLAPQPQLVVSNVTESITNGKALEGTVNRILFKLQAGLQERCSNIRVSVTCFSVLLTPTGTTIRLVSEEALETETENSFDMKTPCFRTPTIVLKSTTETALAESGYGYGLPNGWNVAGNGQGHSYSCTSNLKEGESSFIHIDMFRPATVNTSNKDFLSADETIETEDLADFCSCKTDYYVTITYQQERPSNVKQKIAKRAIRRRPQMGAVSASNTTNSSEFRDQTDAVDSIDAMECYDEVSFEKSGTLIWSSPLTATFRRGTRTGYPSGICHPSNSIAPGIVTSNDEIILHDGECLTTHCSLQLDPSIEEMETEVVSVRFEDVATVSSPVSFELQSTDPSLPGNGVIYQSTEDDPCRLLSAGSRFGISYAIRAQLDPGNAGGVSSSLGSVLVDWLPSTLSLPAEFEKSDCSSLDDIRAHGPLALDFPATIRFRGPSCYVDRVPFEAERLALESDPTVGNPFEVCYRIRNVTAVYQLLHVRVGETMAGFPESGLMIAGLTNGDIWLGPSEGQIVSFMVLPTRPGELKLPSFQLFSDRYQSWLIDSSTQKDHIFVLP